MKSLHRNRANSDTGYQGQWHRVLHLHDILPTWLMTSGVPPPRPDYALARVPRQSDDLASAAKTDYPDQSAKYGGFCTNVGQPFPFSQRTLRDEEP
jgi:hypothetical protein